MALKPPPKPASASSAPSTRSMLTASSRWNSAAATARRILRRRYWRRCRRRCAVRVSPREGVVPRESGVDKKQVVIARSEATKQSILVLWLDGLLRCARNDVAQITRVTPRSRRMTARVFSWTYRLLKIRGRRECRAPDAPAASRVEKNTRVSHHGHAGSPGIPRAMVLTAYFALSPVTGLSCHRRPQETCKKLASQELDASVGASGPHDFAVRRSAPSSTRRLRPPHPVPTSVTIAKRPSVWDGTARDM